MVGYAWIAAALLCGAIKGFCGKKAGAFIRNIGDAAFLSLVRMVLCVGIGCIVSGGFGAKVPSSIFLGVSAIGGIFNALFIITWLLTVRENAYMTVDVFLTAGSFLPAVGSALLFGEPISPANGVGFFLLLTAVIVMALYGKKVKGRLGVKNLVPLVLAGVFEGGVGLSQQLYKYLCREGQGNDRLYNLYVYLFSAIFLLTVFIVFCIQGKSVRECFHHAAGALPLTAVMAACLFAYSLFQTMASTVGNVPSAALYPVLKGGGMLLSCAMAVLFFRERITVSGALGCVLAFSAMIVMNG